jgi:aconitate hydratase
VVGKFVEYFGEGVSTLSLADRATVSNMAPEYGATCGFFPVDEETLNYLKLTGRKKEHIELVERYCRENLMFRDSGSVPEYSEIVEIDLGEVEACLAGPKRPQDIIPLSLMKEEFDQSITREKGYRGFGLSENIVMDGDRASIKNGSVVIAAITSCTNTSNPFVLIGAGLLAKKACELGLEVPPHVKTSLAPGSKVVTAYLRQSGLLEYLERLGFGVVGYGCTTCIGNSGPLRREVEDAIKENDLLVASVLSGNRNFEGRIHPLVKANYLASPPLVVAYALAGSMTVDLYKEPLGRDKNGQDVYLKDIWPTNREIEEIIQKVVASDLFAKEYEDVYEGNKRWNEIADDSGELYGFDEESTYIQNPPFFEGLKLEVEKIKPLENLRVVGMFGDYVTTDHISPAGSISEDSPAGKYLLEKGVKKESFNSYGSRRGNHEVMMRGTLANIRLNNKLAGGKEGGFTRYFPTGEVTSIYNACMRYKQEGVGLVVIAGEGYGMGSSRDWAAKGVALLGVKAVIAKSYERIHRSNLALMGVLPLQFREGESAESLELTGEEVFTIHVDDHIKPRSLVKVTACDKDGNEKEFEVLVRFDSEVEIDYYRHGGILSMVLREKLNG